MDREPEPELMNKKSQVKAYCAADFSLGENNLIKFISNYLKINNIYLSKNDLIVDLGCGPGNISEKLSERWPDVNVLGVDGSQEMIREAESRLFKNKIVNKYRNLNYLCSDIREISSQEIFSRKKITLLVSNSLIHHINHIDNFFKFIVNLSNKETINFHKDLIRPKDEETALMLRDKCSKDEVRKKMKFQWKDEMKISLSDYVVYNNELDKLEEETISLISFLMKGFR